MPVNVTVPGGRPRAGARDRARPAAAAPPRSRSPSPARRSADDLARVEAVRDALGPGGPDPGRRQRRLGRRRRRSRAIRLLDRAAGGLEYVEQPCATRRGAGRRTPARSTCRSPPTSRSAGPPTPTGCATSRPPTSRCSRCSRSAGCGPACGSPRTSGCRSSSRRRWRPRSGSPPGVALAAALPELPYACGLATVQLLDRRRRRPSRCCRSTATLPVGAPDRRPTRARPAGRRRPTGSRTGRPGWPAVRGRAAGWSLVNASTALARAVVDALVAAGVTRGRARARARATPRCRSRRTTPAAAGLLRLHTRIDERTAGFLALGLTKVGSPGRGRLHVRHRGRQPAPGGARGRARRRAAGRGHRRPAGAAARHRRQPDHRPGRASSARWCRRVDLAGRPARPARRRAPSAAPVHLNVQLDDPLVPEDRWTPGAGRRRRSAGPRRRGPRDGADRAAAARAAHRRGRRRRRRPAGAGAGRAGGLAAARRADQRRRAPATNALRCYRLLLGTAARPTRSSGSWSSGTRRCPARSPGCSARDDVEVVARAGARASGRERPFRGRPRRSARGRRRRRRTTRPGSSDGATADARGRPRQLDALLAAEPGLTPYEVAGAVAARAARRAGCWSSAPPARSATST